MSQDCPREICSEADRKVKVKPGDAQNFIFGTEARYRAVDFTNALLQRTVILS